MTDKEWDEAPKIHFEIDPKLRPFVKRQEDDLADPLLLLEAIEEHEGTIYGDELRSKLNRNN